MTNEQRLAKLYQTKGLPFPCDDWLYWLRRMNALGIKMSLGQYQDWWYDNVNRN